MRIDVALCFSAVLCTVYASFPMDNMEDAKLKVKNTIEIVERIMQRVERVHADTKEDTILTVTKRWWQQMDTHRDYVDLLLESMRREVYNAKSRGVDAQQCYDTNSWAINEHSSAAYQSAMKCKESAGKAIETNLGFLDSLMSLGDQLIKELNKIFINCHSDNPVEMQTCILKEFEKINTAVNEFEEDAKYIEYSALPASNYVVLQASQCLANAYLLARFESQSAMMSNSRCVRNSIGKNNQHSLMA